MQLNSEEKTSKAILCVVKEPSTLKKIKNFQRLVQNNQIQTFLT